MMNKTIVKEHLDRGERRYVDLYNRYRKEYSKNENVDVIYLIDKYITFKGWRLEQKNELVKRLNTQRLMSESQIEN